MRYVQNLLIIICFFFVAAAYAQQKQIDSIDRILEKMVNSDDRIQKLDTLISHELEYTDSAVHIYFIDKAISQGINKNNKTLLADAFLAKSKWYDRQMLIDSSRIYADKSLHWATISKDSLTMLSSWRNLGNLEVTSGNYTKALDYFNSILSYCDRNNLANNREKLLTQFNLVGLYYNIDEYDKCIPIYEYLYHHPQVIKDKNWRNETGLNYTMVLFMQKKYEPMLTLAKELETSETRPGMLAYIYGMISGANMGLQRFNEAINYNDKAVSQFEVLGDSLAVFGGNLMTGDIRVDMGDYDAAERIFLEADKKLKESADPPASYIESVYGALSRVYRGKEEYKKAVAYTDTLYRFKDSIKGLEKQNAISELEIQYETEKVKREKEVAEKQVRISQLESNKNKSLFIGALLILGLGAVASLLFFGRQKAKKKAELVTLELRETQKRLALEKQYRDSELKALKAQMNPHFIFNALNSIQEYIILNKKNLAGDYLGKFADLMRKYLQHSDAGTLTIQDEIESLEMYLDLEALRFEDTLSYSFKVSENINKEHLRIPTMLIQPYVENALKHGLLHRKTNRKLWITFTKESDNTLTCCIEDNGVGRDRAATIKAQSSNVHQSFATKATENRLNLLNYEKERKIGVKIIDLFDENGNPKGTRVILNIPTTTN